MTQYYFTKFQIADLTEFASMDITVNVKAGVIVYLNGEEIRRYNLPENTEVTADTAATAESGEPLLLVVGEAVQRERLVVGENILAWWWARTFWRSSCIGMKRARKRTASMDLRF